MRAIVLHVYTQGTSMTSVPFKQTYEVQNNAAHLKLKAPRTDHIAHLIFCLLLLRHLIALVHGILTSFDAGKQVDIAILDFSKTFDKVSHKKFLHKLDHYGVRGPLHTWLTTFLTQRSMRLFWKASPLTRSLWSLGFLRAQSSVWSSFSVKSTTSLPVWHPRSGSLPTTVLSTEKAISSMTT